jgi:hypothetical protein
MLKKRSIKALEEFMLSKINANSQIFGNVFLSIIQTSLDDVVSFIIFRINNFRKFSTSTAISFLNISF